MKTIRIAQLAGVVVRTAVLPCMLMCCGTQAHAAVHALLIAEGNYEGSQGVTNLLGPSNDVRLMKGILIERFQVPESNIMQLDDATHTEIEKAFVSLTAKVKKDDQVYIHYSGHGSWYKSPEAARERRGQDQTWVTHGSRSGQSNVKDAADVLDKELGTWLLKLYDITPDVVLVSDSCHSASVTRDVMQTGARSSEGVPLIHPLRSQFPDVIDLPMDKGLRIGAARDTESAVEVDPEYNTRCTDRKNCYGVFTWNWAQALRASRPGESWGDVYDRALAAIEANPLVQQRPQKEGAGDRAVFAGKFAPLTPTVPVKAIQDDASVLLGAGRLAGLTVGTELMGVVPEGSKPPRLVVVSLTAASAQAKLLEGQVKAGAQLKVSMYRDTEPRIKLFIGGPQVATVDAPWAAQVRQAIEQARSGMLQNFELVDQREAAHWRLELVRPKDGAAAQAGKPPEHVNCAAQPCAAPELWVVNQIGQLMHQKMRFPMAGSEAQLPRLIVNLAQFAGAQEVRGIAKQGNPTPMNMEVIVLRPPAGNVEKCAQGAKETSAWTHFAARPLNGLHSGDVQHRDCLTFRLRNKSTKPWYGYVLSVDTNFGINILWPKVGNNKDTARIEEGKDELIPTFYRLSDSGQETLIFIASEMQTSMDGLSGKGMRSVGGQSPLARLSRMGALSRGIENETDDPGMWGAQSAVLDIVVPDGVR